jgi:integrase
VGKLTAAKVRGLRADGKYLDEAGLALVIRNGKRAWHFRYQRDGRERVMSLGSADVVSLAGARKLHTEARAELSKGRDPLEERNRAKTDRVHTFAATANAYLGAHRSGWRHPKTAAAWAQSLRDHVLPGIGKTPVSEIDTPHVLRVLKPLWVEMPATASKVRGRIELILDFATAMKWRSGPNPATWKGSLRPLLSATARIHTTQHHAAVPWADCPAVWEELSERANAASACLRFLMLTATRSVEARGATWDEIDMANAVWSIPSTRMKMRQAHRVPLSSAALAILHRMAEVRSSKLVFPSPKRGCTITDITLKAQLTALGHGDATVHGFRSSFRDWCADTGRPGDLAEEALAHSVGNRVSQAYRRTDVLELRRPLMQAWSDHLTSNIVVPLRVMA